jgi:hypothetical protein
VNGLSSILIWHFRRLLAYSSMYSCFSVKNIPVINLQNCLHTQTIFCSVWYHETSVTRWFWKEVTKFSTIHTYICAQNVYIFPKEVIVGHIYLNM